MTSASSSPSWRQRLFSAVMLLLIVALGVRLAWELLAPLIPVLIMLSSLAGIYWLILGRRR